MCVFAHACCIVKSRTLNDDSDSCKSATVLALFYHSVGMQFSGQQTYAEDIWALAGFSYVPRCGISYQTVIQILTMKRLQQRTNVSFSRQTQCYSVWRVSGSCSLLLGMKGRCMGQASLATFPYPWQNQSRLGVHRSVWAL